MKFNFQSTQQHWKMKLEEKSIKKTLRQTIWDNLD
jgi:hypothetical protein